LASFSGLKFDSYYYNDLSFSKAGYICVCVWTLSQTAALQPGNQYMTSQWQIWHQTCISRLLYQSLWYTASRDSPDIDKERTSKSAAKEPIHFDYLKQRGFKPLKPSHPQLTDPVKSQRLFINEISTAAALVYCYTELTVSFMTIASTHFTYPQRDGQAELAW